MLDLRDEPMILDMPTFDSKYVSLMVTGYDHYVTIPMSTLEGDFTEASKVMFYSARTKNVPTTLPAGVSRKFEMTGDFVSAVLRIMPHANEPARMAKIVTAMKQVKIASSSEIMGHKAQTSPLSQPAFGKTDVAVYQNNFAEVMQFVVNHTTFDPTFADDVATLKVLAEVGIAPGQSKPTTGQYKTFLVEMEALLEVLDAGDRQLYQRAWKTYHRCQNKIEVSVGQSTENSEETNEHHPLGTNNPHLFRLFTEAFSAQDISEPVRSFDASRPCADVLALRELHDLEIVCLRKQGIISGYVKRVDLEGKLCGDHMRLFRSGQTISADRSLVDVIHILTVQRYGFITMLGEVSGYFSRNDINKPVVRMWLFGIITFVEMEILKVIRENFPNDTWQSAITDKRLEQASNLQQERERRGQQSQILDCLQLSDKVKILVSKQETLDEIGLGSRSSAKKFLKEIESLRNNLSHAQDIVTYDWAQIVRITHRLQEST